MQPYNTLLSLSALTEVSSGILLLQNEVLHATCARMLGIKHPGFKVGNLHLICAPLCVIFRGQMLSMCMQFVCICVLTPKGQLLPPSLSISLHTHSHMRTHLPQAAQG